MSENKVTWALKTGDMEVVRATLVTSEDVNRIVDERSQRVPVHYAADFGNVDVLDYLWSKGAKLEVSDVHGFTPLMIACYENHSNCVKFLLEKGVDKDIKDPQGRSLFELAESDEIKALLK